MNVELLEINQSVSLSDTSTSFSVVFRLPNGQLVQASLNNEATETILGCQVKESSPPQPTPPPPVQVAPPTQVAPPASVPVPTQVPTPLEDTSVFDEVDEDDRVEWRKLDDDVLKARTKAILDAIGLPPIVSVSELKKTVEKVISKLPRADVQPPQRAAPTTVVPGVGQVVWKDGPVVVRRPPIRTVPKTDMGYPIVSGVRETQDPGERIGGGDADEDGVSQL